jgi:Na+/H+ antiporter NhaD/arsenite permease-like protein
MTSQIIALVIFVVMFIVITTGKVQRYIPALIGGVLTILVVFILVERNMTAVTNTLNFSQIVQGNFWIPGHELLESKGVNWQTIFFIAGMMVMVEGLGDVGPDCIHASIRFPFHVY